jgi:hypothetical protein
MSIREWLEYYDPNLEDMTSALDAGYSFAELASEYDRVYSDEAGAAMFAQDWMSAHLPHKIATHEELTRRIDDTYEKERY